MSAIYSKPKTTRRLELLAVPIVATLALLAGQAAQASVVIRTVNTSLNALNFDTFDLDVDLDGTIDFTFTAALVPDPFFTVGFDTVDFPFGSSNGVVIDSVTGDGFPTASRLAAGDTVGPSNLFSFGSFDQGNLFFTTPFDPPSGNFGGQSGFLGLRFARGGDLVFGFAQISVNDINAVDNPLGLTIGSVGYNDVPGQPVQIQLASAVPEPGSLALMGAGGLGFLLLRGRRRGAGAA